MLCSHWWLEYIYIYFFFFLLPISTCWSSLPLSRSPHFSFLPLQASILPLVTDPSPCPALTMLIDLFILRPYLSTNSFFLYSVSQSFSVSNTKIHDCWCWVLILLPWLIKWRWHRDWVLCWWTLFLFWWMGFDFVNGWWMGFVDGWWTVVGFLWFCGWWFHGFLRLCVNGW